MRTDPDTQPTQQGRALACQAAREFNIPVQLAEIFDVSLDYLVLGKEPENNIKATGAYQTAEQKMDIWQFIAGYWWIVLSILGYLSWFLPHILPSIFG